MFEHKILVNEVNANDAPIDSVTDGKNSWSYLQDALDELGADGWELVAGWRNDYKDKHMTPVGIREDVKTERELLLKRQAARKLRPVKVKHIPEPVEEPKGWLARFFGR